MGMMRDRRGFLRDALMFAAASGMPVRLFGAAAELDRPDLRLGVLSDIHIHLAPGDDPARSESVMLFRKALEYFRDRRVDGVLIAGDLADQGLDIELKAVADTWFGVFPDGKLPDGSPVANLMHYGDHDAETRFWKPRKEKHLLACARLGIPPVRSLSVDENRKTCWEEYFHEPWSPVRHVQVKGYDFLLSNFMREGGRSAPNDLAERLAKMDLDPTRPFFYSQHRYIDGTYLADEEMRKFGRDNGVAGKVLPNYPNCIAFQGHTHYMLSDPRGVWIGDYVSVNTGALKSASCGRIRENGTAISWIKDDYMLEKEMPCLRDRRGHGGSVVSVKGDLVTVERRDFGCDLPLRPDIVFSMDRTQRSGQSDAARKAQSVAPQFPAGARVSVSEGMGKDRRKRKKMQVTVSFPTVRSKDGRPRAHEYFVRAESEDGMLLKEKRVFPPGINLPESRDADVSTCVFAKDEIANTGKVRFSVCPANCWGVKGEPIFG